MSCVRISAFLHVFYVSFVIFSCRFVCMCAHMRVSLRVYVQCARVCVCARLMFMSMFIVQINDVFYMKYGQ